MKPSTQIALKTFGGLVMIVLAGLLGAACGKKEHPPENNVVVNPAPRVEATFVTPDSRSVYVKEHTTPSGAQCVIVTMGNAGPAGPAVACRWP